MKKLIMSIHLFTLIAGMAISAAANSPKADAGPTVKSVMAAEEGLAKALRANNADAIQGYLSDGWAVITGFGDVGEGNYIFPEGIKTGGRTLTTFDISEPRVRVFGNSGLVTFKLHLAGVFAGKPFDGIERETDAWVWEDGRWKCVLSHETLFPKDEKGEK